MGNLASVRKALEYIHRECRITDDPDFIRNSDALILPGVGAYAPAMEALRAKGLDSVVKDFASSGKPVLGICLGMQLMLDESEEGSIRERKYQRLRSYSRQRKEVSFG